MKWLDLCWWRFLFEGRPGWTRFWCRARGHAEPVFFASTMLEPDMHCSRCGEDLG